MSTQRMTPGHRLTEIPYHPDSSQLFEVVADLPWAMFLDSGRPGSQRGRYDILVADPRVTLITRGEETVICGEGFARRSRRPALELLRELLGETYCDHSPLPFRGGAVGLFGYELCCDPVNPHAVDSTAGRFPDMAVGIYDWALVSDHQTRRCWLASSHLTPALARQWSRLVARFTQLPAVRERAPYRAHGPVESNLGLAAYAAAFRRIKHYLREGDCYQVNLTREFNVPVSGDPWLAYQHLREISPAPFSAYLKLPWGEVLSVSPERFLQIAQGAVETSPIKGTRPRNEHPQTDRRLARELAESEKDRAENLMIVDLLRNDLGRYCQPGSVRVPRLFEVQSFSNVHHLVTTIRADLPPAGDPLALFGGAFPGGSITGAPKRRAMQVIRELEPHRRGVYCGSIGYLGYDGTLDTNIAIRTLLQQDGVARFWAGGGVVADSQLEAEYQETLDKAAGMLRLMQESGASLLGTRDAG